MKQWQELINIIASIDDSRFLTQFFDEILTPTEKKNLYLRWKLLKALHQKKTQREIAANFKISLCKITRGSKILKTPKSAVKAILDKNFSSFK